jgi:hypothetical protein
MSSADRRVDELEARVNALVSTLNGIVPRVESIRDRVELVAAVADAPGPRLPTREELDLGR